MTERRPHRRRRRRRRRRKVGITKGQKRLYIWLVVLVLLAADLDYWYLRVKHYRQRAALLKEESEIGHNKRKNVKSGPDDLVALKAEHPMSLQDEKDLRGRTLWVNAGGQLDYYAYNGHAVEFGHSQGVLLGAQKIEVKDAVLQSAPASAAVRIPQGDGQVLLVFTLPDDTKNSAKEYAVAVGDKEGANYNLLTDQIFFYDDPHKLYSYWGPQIWDGIDHHKAILGMSERQVEMALGQVSTPRGDIMGDRTVEFDDQGHPKMVTFVNGKATEIKDVGE